jgi:hypothetical protein
MTPKRMPQMPRKMESDLTFAEPEALSLEPSYRSVA